MKNKSRLMVFQNGLGTPVRRILQPAEIQEILKRIRMKLEALPQSVFAYAHGSFAADGPSRDIDVAVQFIDMPRGTTVDLCLETSASLSRELGIPVDIHPIDTESLGFAFSVASGTLLFTKNSRQSDRFEEIAVMRYMDFKPLLRSIFDDLVGR